MDAFVTMTISVTRLSIFNFYVQQFGSRIFLKQKLLKSVDESSFG